MRKRYYLLPMFTFISAALWWITDHRLHWSWLSTLSGNMVAGFVASFLTVLLIDRALERDRQAKSDKLHNFVLSCLRPALWNHLNFLCQLYKAATINLRESRPDSLDKLFDDSYYEQIRYLDFAKAAPVSLATDWFLYAAQEVERFKASIHGTLDKYAVLLESDLIELLESLENSTFTEFLISQKDVLGQYRKRVVGKSYNILAGVEVDTETRKHIELVLKLIEKHNSISTHPITVDELHLWRTDIAPRLGSGRIDIETLDPKSLGIPIVDLVPEAAKESGTK